MRRCSNCLEMLRVEKLRMPLIRINKARTVLTRNVARKTLKVHLKTRKKQQKLSQKMLRLLQ